MRDRICLFVFARGVGRSGPEFQHKVQAPFQGTYSLHNLFKHIKNSKNLSSNEKHYIPKCYKWLSIHEFVNVY